MKDLPTWKLVRSSLQRQLPVMLMLVVESSGSSPGRPGFLMAVNILGEMQGSLGGGIMEHKFTELARVKLHNGVREVTLFKQVHNSTAPSNRSGMICSGEQTNLLYFVTQNEYDSVDAVITCFEEGRQGLLAITPAKIDCLAGNHSTDNISFSQVDENHWCYTQTIGYPNRLYIVGGGHCSLALSRIMSQLDFYVVLVEERPNLKTMNENVFANEKQVVEDYKSLSTHIPPGENHYVAIMTFGYRSDAIALQALEGKQFRYLGVLGSQAKIDKMFMELYGETKSKEKLREIHAPIGLPINSHTPEEVAVSIAAEIIRVKNGV
jgi:xanthine dehydrogenase accessory factor